MNFVPDFRFNSFDEASVEFLLANGIRGLILDIDNTLEPYENPKPSQKVVDWLSSLKEAGIACAFVSNNNKERVELFNFELNLPAFYKAGKPLKKNMLSAMERMGTAPHETAIMGDQVFTDVWAGRNVKIKTILLPPIKDKRDVFTRFKRLLEKPFLKKYNKLHNTDKKEGNDL